MLRRIQGSSSGEELGGDGILAITCTLHLIFVTHKDRGQEMESTWYAWTK
jgi:hypothetical protein